MGKVTGFLEIERQQPTRRAVEDRLQDWFEIYEPFTEDKQREQGARCMDSALDQQLPGVHRPRLPCSVRGILRARHQSARGLHQAD